VAPGADEAPRKEVLMKSKTRFDRRRFLELLSAAGVAVYLPGCGSDDGQPPANPPASTKKALVLGGGLAGLAAAYELQKKGWDVTVLEAQASAGGRVLTQRDGFENGQYAELGATRIPDVHDHTIGYVEELGLKLEEFPGGTPLYYLGGQRFVHTEGTPWPLAGLSPEEALEGLGMWSTYIAANFEAFGNPKDGTYPRTGILEQYDKMVMTDFLKEKGATDAWLPLYVSDNGTEVYKIGCLAWMALEVADQDWDLTYHVQGGNDQIAQKLVEKLDGKVKFERIVKSITQDDTKVSVTVDAKGMSETYEADYLVCTIPFKPLRDVAFSPALPDDKQKAMDEVFMMTSSRAMFQTKTRFWKNDPLGELGGLKLAKTDTKAERVWDLTATQPGDTGILLAYMQSDNADDFAALAAPEREAYIQAEMAKFFPDIEAEKLSFHVKIWSEDPWAQGAWTEILPNQWWMMAVIPRSEGRIHFAGEHTSIWAGWMQGAIESGKRAANEIMQKS